MRPNALIKCARYDRTMEAVGGKGFFVEDPKHLRVALDEAMNLCGPALVNVIS
jgi:2-hydroxyacyl-CoA lyase 1